MLPTLNDTAPHYLRDQPNFSSRTKYYNKLQLPPGKTQKTQIPLSKVPCDEGFGAFAKPTLSKTKKTNLHEETEKRRTPPLSRRSSHDSDSAHRNDSTSSSPGAAHDTDVFHPVIIVNRSKTIAIPARYAPDPDDPPRRKLRFRSTPRYVPLLVAHPSLCGFKEADSEEDEEEDKFDGKHSLRFTPYETGHFNPFLGDLELD
eukprot:gb/GEZN01008724.1/.p1 GENE.gb/GEZN01008724.1/~~gb/GEZN01008724.1/.p1  ORF type:complete len:202 (-),score=27.63 gb/GEZN01008724.1/:516-1121(-)